MTNTPEQFIAYCLAHPQDRDGSTWDQKCVSLVFRAGGFTDSRDSAYRAALATEAAGHKLDTTTPLDRLPVGWFVYFDKAGPDNGHIGMTTGNGQFGSANWRAKGWGTALGLMSIQGYINTGARYMGASPYFINTTLNLSASSAALSTAAISDRAKPATPLRKENTMRLVAGQPSNRRFALGELTYQELPGEQASHSAHVWESPAGGLAHGEPLVVDDATLDLEIGQIQQRRAQLAGVFNSLRA